MCKATVAKVPPPIPHIAIVYKIVVVGKYKHLKNRAIVYAFYQCQRHTKRFKCF